MEVLFIVYLACQRVPLHSDCTVAPLCRMDPYHKYRGTETFLPSFCIHFMDFLKVLLQMAKLLEGFLALLTLVGSASARSLASRPHLLFHALQPAKTSSASNYGWSAFIVSEPCSMGWDRPLRVVHEHEYRYVFIAYS